MAAAAALRPDLKFPILLRSETAVDAPTVVCYSFGGRSTATLRIQLLPPLARLERRIYGCNLGAINFAPNELFYT